MKWNALVIATILGGCVTEVPAGYHPTGKLRIATRLHSESFGVREQVGQVQYSGGGTANIYADRTVTQTALLWRPLEGDRAIADEDFFRAVGDEPAADSSAAYRSRGRWLSRLGIVAAVIGAGVFVYGKTQGDVNAMIGGSIGFSLGPVIAYYGYAYQHPDNHAVPYSRAEQDLERLPK